MPDWAAIPLVIPPIFGLFVLFAIASWTTYIFVAVVFVLGLAFYYLQQVAKRRNWCEFIVPTKGKGIHSKIVNQDEVIVESPQDKDGNNNNKNNLPRRLKPYEKVQKDESFEESSTDWEDAEII